MSVKNIFQHHGATTEQLQALTTRHLTQILGSARVRINPESGNDEDLDVDQVAFNKNQSQLQEKLKEVLATRENVVKNTKQVKKKEKKVLAY